MDTLIQYAPIMTFEEAKLITGGLAQTSKMPCPSWGIPAKYCRTGQLLRKHPNTSCSKCYAMRGFMNGFARGAYERRFENAYHPQWVEAMIWLISDSVSIRTPYFRWFCSGDLQSLQMLTNIVEVCEALPSITFWLPTQERRLIERWSQSGKSLPANLTIRFSSPFAIDSPAPRCDYPQSNVVTAEPTCPASKQQNRCLECRACWDRNVPLVSYLEH